MVFWPFFAELFASSWQQSKSQKKNHTKKFSWNTCDVIKGWNHAGVCWICSVGPISIFRQTSTHEKKDERKLHNGKYLAITYQRKNISADSKCNNVVVCAVVLEESLGRTHSEIDSARPLPVWTNFDNTMSIIAKQKITFNLGQATAKRKNVLKTNYGISHEMANIMKFILEPAMNWEIWEHTQCTYIGRKKERTINKFIKFFCVLELYFFVFFLDKIPSCFFFLEQTHCFLRDCTLRIFSFFNIPCRRAQRERSKCATG